jgi:hypothetical protein
VLPVYLMNNGRQRHHHKATDGVHSLSQMEARSIASHLFSMQILLPATVNQPSHTTANQSIHLSASNSPEFTPQPSCNRVQLSSIQIALKVSMELIPAESELTAKRPMNIQQMPSGAIPEIMQ